eukprot:3855198-Rhodomonas_salina.1
MSWRLAETSCGKSSFYETRLGCLSVLLVLLRGQIFMNLISNAVKFTEEGEVEVSAEQNEDFVKVVVSDTGIGIPQDKIKTIWDIFQQVSHFLRVIFEKRSVRCACLEGLALTWQSGRHVDDTQVRWRRNRTQPRQDACRSPRRRGADHAA